MHNGTHMASGGVQSMSVSTETNFAAGVELFKCVLSPPLAICDVVCRNYFNFFVNSIILSDQIHLANPTLSDLSEGKCPATIPIRYV